ncbi:MAG TPA: TolC family protein [Ottowia sp.]|uniref:TolC family protein n=1 Tax=Ottowia sp. TaxID=1898956 RepID=UPI0011D76730|nr:TolC family protein [Ottowia sp.]MCZ2090693.1 TolC family protein [Burkholderiales bacterium]TXI21171.1 MAG: transporter [Ottowia sp.]HNJ44933.1 TolC family protein [Ottowia sp.]HNN33413.1 TolC family protein [Ottowia sp.]HNR82375.1 TolC family protein [Ottowia sp.]
MKRLTRLVLVGAALGVPVGAWAQDLLTVWRAAAGHDQRLAVARAEHGASQTLRAQADALWRPQVGLNLGLGLGVQDTAMRGARFSAPGMGQVDEARFATSVTGGLATRVAVQAQQPLVNATRQAQQAQLRLGADMGDIAWRGAQADLMLRTTERYLALAVAQERVRVVERQWQAVSRSRAEAHDRYQLGASPITDTHEADAALAGVRAQQSAAELELSVQRDRLAGSTGLAQPRARLPLAPLAPVEALPFWLAAAESDNPRLRLLAQAVALAEQKLRQHSVAGRATLDLVAQAGHERIAGGGDFGSARNRSLNGMVGVQLNIPLYTGGMREAQEREAAERLNQAMAELELAREDVAQQVRATWQGLQTGAARLAALQEGLVASRARLDATRLGREVGDRTTLDVLNAENAQADAELALAQARSDQVLTRLRLAALADRLDEALLTQVDATLAPEVPR